MIIFHQLAINVYNEWNWIRKMLWWFTFRLMAVMTKWVILIVYDRLIISKRKKKYSTTPEMIQLIHPEIRCFYSIIIHHYFPPHNTFLWDAIIFTVGNWFQTIFASPIIYLMPCLFCANYMQSQFYKWHHYIVYHIYNKYNIYFWTAINWFYELIVPASVYRHYDWPITGVV